MKKDMATEEEKKIAQMGNTSGKTMAERFLASITTSNDDFKIAQKKSTSKQKFADVDGHTMVLICTYLIGIHIQISLSSDSFPWDTF